MWKKLSWHKIFIWLIFLWEAATSEYYWKERTLKISACSGRQLKPKQIIDQKTKTAAGKFKTVVNLSAAGYNGKFPLNLSNYWRPRKQILLILLLKKKIKWEVSQVQFSKS